MEDEIESVYDSRYNYLLSWLKSQSYPFPITLLPDGVCFKHPYIDKLAYEIWFRRNPNDSSRIDITYSCGFWKLKKVTAIMTGGVEFYENAIIHLNPLIQTLINEFINVSKITTENYYFLGAGVEMDNFISEIKSFEDFVDSSSYKYEDGVFSFKVGSVDCCVIDNSSKSISTHLSEVISSIDAIIPVEVQREVKLSNLSI